MTPKWTCVIDPAKESEKSEAFIFGEVKVV